MTDIDPSAGPAERILRRLPILGFAIRCAESGEFGRLAVLGLNVVMAVVLLVLWFGWPAFITIILAMTGLVATLILLATRG